MLPDELTVTVETQEIKLTVEEIPSIDLSIPVTPDVIIVGSPGFPGPPGSSGVPVDTVVPANTRIISNKLLDTDSQPAWRLYGSGKEEWGIGGSTIPDVNLYRSAQGRLQTDQPDGTKIQLDTWGTWSYLTAVSGVAADGGSGIAFQGATPDEAMSHWELYTWQGNSGLIVWTPSAGGIIKFDRFNAAGAYGDNGGLRFGTVGNFDVSLWRSNTGYLTTDAWFEAFDGITVGIGNVTPINLSADGHIYFGSAWDTSLYRKQASWLKTDGYLDIGGAIFANAGQASQVALGGSPNGTVYFGSAQDVNLYRAGANMLATDDWFLVKNTLLRVDGHVDVDFADVGGKLRFGSLLDTNLYRFAANQLKTDDDLIVSGSGGINSTVGQIACIGNFYSYGGAGIVRIDRTNPWEGAYASIVPGDVDYRHIVTADGGHYWGPGNVYNDTNLYRAGANILKTDDDFYSAAWIYAGIGRETLIIGDAGPGATAGIKFGSAQDVNLYRSAANTLKTDDNFVVGGNLTVLGSGGVGGDLVKLVDTVLAATSTTIDLTSIAATYADLIIVLSGIITSGIDNLQVRFNGDSGGNYNYTLQAVGGTSNNAAENQSGIRLGRIRDAGTWGNTASFDDYQIEVLDYSRTDRWKNTHFRGGFTVQSGFTGQEMYYGIGQWKNTAAINRVTFVAESGASFDIGCRVRIYGRN